MGLVLEKVRKTALSQPSLKHADCWLFSFPPHFQEVVRNSPLVASVYQLTLGEERLLERQQAWKTLIMCEGQERCAGPPEESRGLGTSSALNQLRPGAVGSSEPGACHVLYSLAGPPLRWEEMLGAFRIQCLVLMAHVSKTFRCLQDWNHPCNKVGRILNQVRALGF